MAHVSVAGIAVYGRTVFIAKRNPTGQMASRWEFPGGKVDPGEGEETALAREFKEEFGIDITVGSRIAEAFFEHNGQSVCLHAYHITVPHRGQSRPYTLTEHTEYTWASIETIPQLSFVDSDLLLYPAVKDFVIRGKGAL